MDILHHLLSALEPVDMWATRSEAKGCPHIHRFNELLDFLEMS